MSLLQRVTSFEALSPERGRSPDGSRSPRARKLSFSPLPGSWHPPTAQEDEAIGAYEIPKARRIRECFLSIPLLLIEQTDRLLGEHRC
jgi:hypothetical protein